MARNVTIDVGATVGPFEIVSEIKRGGMATLFVARRLGAAGFTRHVAIKVVHPHLAQDEQFVRMFIDEAKLAAQIKHPNVVHVEELGKYDGAYFLVMEYIHGCSLSELLRSLAEQHRRLRPEIATWIAAQIAKGLHAAHELCDPSGQALNVVHRDVSPHNILLSVDGHVKLIDFGVAKAERRAVQTKPGALRGKLRYMAPEQLSGNVDRRTDLYALGIVLWEMLCGRRRFIGDEIELLEQIRNPTHPPPSRMVDVPRELDEAVLSVLSTDPKKRPQTGREFAQRLIDAVPGVAKVDAKNVSEVIRHFANSVIEARQLQLPESITGLSISLPEVSGQRQIVEQLTISEAGRHALDLSGEQVPSWTGPTKPSSRPVLLGIGAGVAVGVVAAIAVLMFTREPTQEQPAIAHPPPETAAAAAADAGGDSAEAVQGDEAFVFRLSDDDMMRPASAMTETPTMEATTAQPRTRRDERSRQRARARMRAEAMRQAAASMMTEVVAPPEPEPPPREAADPLPGFTTSFD